MLGLTFDQPDPLRILAVGAHPDDIEIGAGGTLMELLSGDRVAVIDWVVLSGDDGRAEEARTSALKLVAGRAELSVEVAGFRENYFPHQVAIKERFDDLGRRARPDIVLAPRREDRHQDHAVVAELVWQTFRDHLVLEYEIPKYEGDLGAPNAFVPLSRETAERKVAHLLTAFPSQRHRPWFRDDAFKALLRLRGIESNAASGFAEAFICRKLTLSVDQPR